MTKLPTQDWSVEPVEMLGYKVGPKCSAPDCSRWADHAHHIFRRSFLAGDYAWVSIPTPDEEPVVVGNLCGLCYQHHQEVTENRSWIQWDYASKRYAWLSSVSLGWFRAGELDPHPPFPEMLAEGSEKPPDAKQEESGHCPTCQRRLPSTGLTKLPRRRRKSWLVSVPDDSEDGAMVLDTLVEECAKIFQREEHSDFRYFTLVEAMTLLLQHKEQIS